MCININNLLEDFLTLDQLDLGDIRLVSTEKHIQNLVKYLI